MNSLQEFGLRSISLDISMHQAFICKLNGQVCFAGCRLQVEKWTFKSELVYLALRLA